MEEVTAWQSTRPKLQRAGESINASGEPPTKRKLPSTTAPIGRIERKPSEPQPGKGAKQIEVNEERRATVSFLFV